MNKQSIKDYLLVLFLYTGIGILITYPLISNLGTMLYGLPGDGYGTLWSFWWNTTHGIEWSAPAQPTLLAAARVLSYLFNEVATYNLLILLGYPLAGFAIYLIVHHFTNDKIASFLAGFIYILGPYHIYQSYVHLSLAMIAWLPFYMYALLLWLKDPRPLRALVSGLLLALVILDNYYYGYLAILVTIFFVIGLLIQIYRGKLSFWTALGQGLIAGTTAVVIVLPFILPAFYTGATTNYSRPIREIFVFQAKWWDFFVPPITHPLVGKLIRATTSYELVGSNYFERTLYLGYMPLFLAILGAWRCRKSWLIYFLLILFATSLVFATVPDFLGEVLHSWFPTFRVYSRFGLLSLMVTAILAGIGLASISKGVRSWMLYAAFALFVLADFYPLLPSPLVDVTTIRPVEATLADQSPGLTIVYPLASDDEVRTSEYLADSRRYNQPLFNAIYPAYHQESLREAIMDPTKVKSLSILKRLGVSYLMIRKDAYQGGRIPSSLWPYYDPEYPRYLPAWNNGAVPQTDKPELNLTLLHNDDYAALYRIN